MTGSLPGFCARTLAGLALCVGLGCGDSSSETGASDSMDAASAGTVGTSAGTDTTASATASATAASDSATTSASSGATSQGGTTGTTGDPPDPSCEIDDSCVDDTPSTCGDDTCDATDHCDSCTADCPPCSGTAPVVVRGPYLQSGASDSIVVRWRTENPTDSVVAYGPSPDQLLWVTSDAAETTEHEVVITGLSAATRYAYAFGRSDAPLLGKDDSHHFYTAPTPGTQKPTRIWLLGDSGNAGSAQRAVRDAFVNFTGQERANVWIMLGDNAYSDGTDAEYQDAVFDPDAYFDQLKNNVLWPTIGNHERVSDNGDDAPYFNIFSLPVAAEAGGLESGTEYYYSFDYGAIHFVCLDSDTNADSQTVMTWLENDLGANDKPWLIAFWHHPPYTNGSHNSDDEGSLVDMRENYLPILESYGVDLVFTGHSHSYERSVLLYGHYGFADDLTDEMILAKVGTEKADGDPDGDGPYQKVDGSSCPDVGVPLEPDAYCGTVYSVVGSSAQVSASGNPTRYDGGVLLPAMYTYQETLGSVVVDIDGDQADVVFLDSGDSDPTADYTVSDRYRIVK